jgi:D-aminoacyl-tRNA deacylase
MRKEFFMKVVIQRVKAASVNVDDRCVGKIGKGLLLLVGIGKDDTRQKIDKFVDKIIKLRIFEDQQGKTNLSLSDVEGEILAVSQFTLYADCKKGNRPNFLQAASPDLAEELYDYFLSVCRDRLGKVEAGEFGANMQVELVNDGPFTVILEDSDLGF